MVERVNPTNLTKNFANMLAKPVIASNVVTKVKLHKGLMFRNELAQNMSEDCTILARDFGNVTEDSIFTFEYTIKTIAQLIEMEDLDLTKVKQFPFQAQVSYTALDGSKYLRVITSQQQVSNEREELEQMADHNMLYRNAIQQSSKIARGGDVSQAQAISKTWNRHMKQAIRSEAQVNEYQNFNN